MKNRGHTHLLGMSLDQVLVNKIWESALNAWAVCGSYCWQKQTPQCVLILAKMLQIDTDMPNFSSCMETQTHFIYVLIFLNLFQYQG